MFNFLQQIKGQKLKFSYSHYKHKMHCSITSGVFKGGGGGATAPPPLWPDHKFFWLILHCFVGFISRLNRIKSVSRGMDVCVIACYYTDIHARPEASSDMSVFTITAGWLLLANFNRWTVANAVHRD